MILILTKSWMNLWLFAPKTRPWSQIQEPLPKTPNSNRKLTIQNSRNDVVCGGELSYSRREHWQFYW